MSVELLSPVWTHLTEIQPEKGRGVHLYDKQGNRYVDFTSGIGVVNTGHCHPRVVRAVRDQAEDLLFAQMNCVISPQAVNLAEKLNRITPPELDRFFFTNSGAEATEAAVKLAKAATGRSNIIVFQGSFHGRTHMAMAMTTSKTVYRYKYQPLPSGVFTAPFPHSRIYEWNEEKTVDFCLKQLHLLLQSQSAPGETAAIIIEPVLGEGGYIPVPQTFLQELRTICDKYGILLIIDEIQSGFGRTGKMFCFEHSGVIPDILVMAKGLGSGLPVAAIASGRELMEKWPAGTHGGTYGGGSGVALAAASATIDVLLDEDLSSNASERGLQLMTGLKKMAADYPFLADIRGLGLMVGAEICDEKGEPLPELTSEIIAQCLEEKLLLLSCGSYRNVIRFIPPLVVSEEEMQEALLIFNRALERASEKLEKLTINNS
ncbi:aspartate aminotransferase family protein [Robertkochia aurantiaca]|uniref:aspartate aminotransferase family protein n=1 Tax=Robertkochia aurantiaca TaxID=2873700 RepID=UPI001CCE0ECF|nr:aspartate aminotransferase family protein [Robertkochia sp. 3YJGBD-33]